MNAPLRIAIGGIRYESNSFAGAAGPADCFETHTIRRGADVLDRAEANSEVAGALDIAAAESSVELIGLLDTFGGCGAPVPDDVYADLRDELLARLESAGPVDAVYVPLHGAMTTTERYDVEADLLAGVRRLVGPDVPVITSFDLHAAVSETTVGVVDAIVGFKTCPHVDYVETGQRAMTLAVRSARREIRPGVVRVAVPMLTASEAHDTTSGPLAPHMRRLQRTVADGILLDGSIFACQPWLDTLRSTWTVTITSDTGDESRAASVAEEAASALLGDLESFRIGKTATGELWAAIDRLLDEHHPVLVSDSGDSPSAGALGDSVDCLRELIAPGRPRVLATVTDRAAALAAHESGCGSTLRLDVGGSLTPGPGASLAIEGEVVSLHDGRFVQTYPATPVDAGPCAVLRVANTDLVVTSRPVIMLDTSIFEHVGTAPTDYAVVQVKSAGGFRALWSTVSTTAVVADSLGASTSRLTELPFTRLPAPLWPFATPSPQGVPA